MSQFVDGNTKTFLASGALAQYARVKLDSNGALALAGATDKEIGTATREAFAAGDPIAVKLRSAAGTHKMIAEDAISVNDAVFTTASGKVGDSATGAFALGTALGAATADGDIIEVLYNAHGDTAAS